MVKQVEARPPAPVVPGGRLVVGIDPDLVKSGVALAKDGQLISLLAEPFPQLLKHAQELVDSNALFVVENVEHDKTTYRRGKTNAKTHAAIAQKVGQVKGVARVLVECLQDMGADIHLVKPLTGPAKRKAKDDAQYFNQITGWQGNSNQDKRDAGLLALFAVPKGVLSVQV
ncbi:MAG: hypothetical protein MK185_06675 [Saccharospirillaceae bacterium]|nr:hypothetical protein [Saccharospirillaceae bacterium]